MPAPGGDALADEADDADEWPDDSDGWGDDTDDSGDSDWAGGDEFEQEFGAAPAVDTSLQLYGFADASYYIPLLADDNSWRLRSDGENEFTLGSLNLYLRKRLDRKWSTLMEVRFLLLPNGFADGTGASLDTTVADPSPTRADADLRWGGVEIERAWVQYELHPRLDVRAGMWLTPYGIWNIDHGTPLLVTPWRPFSLSLQPVPERQTGLQLIGHQPLGTMDLEYRVGISNGRGPLDSYRDLDGNKALSARVALSGHDFGEWRVGAFWYRGRYTNREKPGYGPMGVESPLISQFDEQAFSADLQWFYRGIELRAEANLSERHYLEGARAVTGDGSDGGGAVSSPFGTDTAFVPDFRRFGAYAIVGYRFGWNATMPYVLLDTASLGDVPFAAVTQEPRILGLGVQARPTASITTKLVYIYVKNLEPDDTDDAQFVQTQIAWSF